MARKLLCSAGEVSEPYPTLFWSARSLKPPAFTNMPTLQPLILGLMSTTFWSKTLTPPWLVPVFAGVRTVEHVMRGLRCTLLAAGVHPCVNVLEVEVGLA